MSMQELQRMVKAIDQRVGQLAAQGIKGRALIEYMTAYLPDLQRIYNGTTNRQLHELASIYPRFETFALVMEDAFDAMRRNPSKSAKDGQELPDALSEGLSALMTEAATLEREFQALLDAGVPTAMSDTIDALRSGHSRWRADRERQLLALKEFGQAPELTAKATTMLTNIADRIAQLELRLTQLRLPPPLRAPAGPVDELNPLATLSSLTAQFESQLKSIRNMHAVLRAGSESPQVLDDTTIVRFTQIATAQLAQVQMLRDHFAHWLGDVPSQEQRADIERLASQLDQCERMLTEIKNLLQTSFGRNTPNIFVRQ